MSNFEQLAHALKIKFGLPPNSPTDQEMVQIVSKVVSLPEKDRTDENWAKIIREIIPDAGKYHYSGLDMSDINTLLSQIISKLGKK